MKIPAEMEVAPPYEMNCLQCLHTLLNNIYIAYTAFTNSEREGYYASKAILPFGLWSK